MEHSQNDIKTKKQLKTLRYILKLVYPKANSYLLIIYVFIKYIVRVNNMSEEESEWKFRTLPDKLYYKLVKSLLKNHPANDSSHCVFVPEHLFDKLYSENFLYRDEASLWITLKLCISKNENKKNFSKKILAIESPIPQNISSKHQKPSEKFRSVQILPIKSTKQTIYTNETEYFNVVNYFCMKNSENCMKFKFVPFLNQIDAPKIARKVVVQMVNASLPVGTDLTDVLLNNYFKKLKLLNNNDFFCIPLIGKYMTNMYLKYSNVANECEKVYFKCIEVEIEDGNTNAGFFVIKGKTELVQEQNINSFIPKCNYLMSYIFDDIENLEDQIMPYCSYGFETVLRNMEIAIKPFILDSSVNPLHNSVKVVIQPMFLIRSGIGSGVSDLVQALSKKIGVNYFSTTCRHLMASTSKQSESKLDALLQRAKNVAPVLILLDEFEKFGLDIESNEESRIVDSFRNQLKNLFENFTKQPIIIFANCLDTHELNNSLSRLFLETFHIGHLAKEQRKLHLCWFLQFKKINIGDENFCPYSNNKTGLDNNSNKILETKKQIILKKGKTSLNKKIKAKKSIDDDESALKMVAIEQSLQSNSISTEIETLNKEKHKRVSKSPESDTIFSRFNENVIKIVENIVSKTETFTYNDLDVLTNIALKIAYQKQVEYFKEKNEIKFGIVREVDFYDAVEKMRSIQSHKMNAVKIPNVNWEDIGGLKELKKEIFKTIELPLKYPQLLMSSSLKRSGLLLWGPPGCGKTLVARAIASQLQASFLSIKGPELLDMYVGQSEKNMREVFANARASAPCVIFLDEAEAAAGARGASGDSAGAADRLVSQLLAELDGVASRQHESETGPVIVVAATNRPDLVEPALLRPGRLDKLLYVGPYEGETDKLRVLEASCRSFNLSSCVDLKEVANKLPNKCTGADLASIVNKSRKLALARAVKRAENGEISSTDLNEEHVLINKSDFENSIENFIPSLTDSELNYYESLKSKLS